jgi:hypothetical protein
MEVLYYLYTPPYIYYVAPCETYININCIPQKYFFIRKASKAGNITHFLSVPYFSVFYNISLFAKQKQVNAVFLPKISKIRFRFFESKKFDLAFIRPEI